MATIERRVTQAGTLVYRAKIRRKGLPSRSATFADVPAARRWARETEAALLAERALPPAQRRTLGEAIARYEQEVLPRKSPASQTMQTLQLRWWATRVGDRPLADLTPALVTTYREQLTRGDGGAPARRRR